MDRLADKEILQRGQSLVLIALVMIVLLGIVGLVLDGGTAYLARRDAQNASDAAAFAGGQALRKTGQTDQGVRDVVNAYAQANHVANPSSDVIAYYLDKNSNQIVGNQVGSNGANPPPNGATGIVVTSTITINPFFMGLIMGNGQIPIPARAKVQTGQLTAPGGPLVPMVVPLPLSCPIDQTWVGNVNCGGLTAGKIVDLVGTTLTSGNVQWLNLQVVNPVGSVPSCNENCVAEYIAGDHNPPPPNVKIGDWLQATTGLSTNKCTSGQTKDTSVICAVDYWLDKPTESERRWIAPIYKIDNGQTGNNTLYKIIAFATFYPTGYHMGNGAGWERNFINGYCTDPFTLQPADPAHPQNAKCIEGKFMGFTSPPGEVDPTAQCNLNPLNVCGVQLTE